MLRTLNNLRNREDGFTLIEFLIVVLIILILTGIAVPFYLSALKRGYVTSITSDVSQSATRYSTFYASACNGNDTCALPSQTDWETSIRVRSDPTNNVLKAYVYVPGATVTGGSAEDSDANDYYANGIVCVQGTTNKVDSGDPENTWSIYFTLGQGGTLTSLSESSDGTNSKGSLRRGGCDGTTPGASSGYLNSNQDLINAGVSGWIVSTTYS